MQSHETIFMGAMRKLNPYAAKNEHNMLHTLTANNANFPSQIADSLETQHK